MAKRKIPVVTPPVKVKIYPLLEDAIEAGLKYGLRRMFKHDSTPKSEDQVFERTDEILNSIMVEVCQLLDFGDE